MSSVFVQMQLRQMLKSQLCALKAKLLVFEHLSKLYKDNQLFVDKSRVLKEQSPRCRIDFAIRKIFTRLKIDANMFGALAEACDD